MASVSTGAEAERPKWTKFQEVSAFTFPVAVLGAVLIWLLFFTLIYDLYVTSFGSTSYYDYIAQARVLDSIAYTWSVIRARNTVGLSILALVLASPFLFFLLCLWMLKGGRALSRKILYLLHIRSMFTLIAHTALIFAAAYAAVIVYGVVFYLVASRAGGYAAIADYYGAHLAAMYQVPFGATDAAGTFQRPSRQIVLAALAGLAAAGALVGFPIGAAIQKRQRMIMGKARLATLKDAADFRLRDKHGIVLGLKQGLLLRNDGDQHVMVIGSPGQGKSRGFVIPTMMSFKGSQMVLDMSGELFEETSGYLKDRGYEIFLLAPGSKFTDGYNPLDLISADPNQRITDLQKLTQMLLPERLRSDSSDFWEESARILLTAMLGFVLECPDTRKSLSELYRILNSMSDERKAIIQLLENYEAVLSDQTRMQLTKFAGRHEKLGEGIAAEIVAKLNFLQNPLVEALTSITTIPIDTIRTRKLVIFIQADWNAMQIYERLISMFIQQMADKLVQMGPLRNGEHEVLMMLDEFGNGGRIDTVLTLAPLIRKNGVRFVFILQDGAQLERLYQRSGQKILMGASTIKLFMNFQNQEDAAAVSAAAGRTTEWVEQSSYSHRHGRRQRSISKVPVSVDLLPVNTLMMMKPEEAILQVTGMPLMRIMKLDSGGERMFSKVQKFKPVIRPCMEPVEWTIADSEAVWPGAPAPETTPFARTASQLSGAGMDVDLGAIERPREAQSVRFIVKEGVRHVYISSLDELRQRLDLDETREAGVSEDEPREENQKAEQNKRPGTTANPPATRPAARGSGPMEVENVRIEIDQAKLDRNVYQGSPRPRHRLDRTSDIQDEAGTSPGSVLLRRQEVRGAFGADIKALNDAIFEQADAGSLDPMELNADVELLIGTLSGRLAEDSSKAFLREFANLARDPLREDSARHDDADRVE
ncbi:MULTISPECIES: type IV secretory system conjugative DNA transfer family protein [unclassified Rhizobium]|jgi:type IV secretion system protein VirD4|uniref:type IV secretory system conjugative DNA transfer family protein n=2 Tax=Bacteria TaxID=2 RepID=UPI000646D30F|nr:MULTISPECIES: type IV secretory system conjugative DNA transfer family protein [unclassified Rhizobium]TXI10061.1 MAG: type IV secretory system conjugative DNA transfer family protein [Rhizobium sp.]NKJ08472.1 type IV secretory pathway TraG/TraD family ATPase VirD4 [Rhizobium sp. SG741]OCJ08255.1 conjugal transfer protein TraG [Rhizobium sp. AC27/96]RKD50478.1 type IV secretory pathway TraG/TraD family ATPase VirD4 [Rhizobium sp. WW_1]TIX93295.1 type IV secretory system conjugative DNA tran